MLAIPGSVYLVNKGDGLNNSLASSSFVTMNFITHLYKIIQFKTSVICWCEKQTVAIEKLYLTGCKEVCTHVCINAPYMWISYCSPWNCALGVFMYSIAFSNHREHIGKKHGTKKRH